MARIAFDKKTGCTKSKSVAREYDSETEVLSKVPEMVRKVVKLIVLLVHYRYSNFNTAINY